MQVFIECSNSNGIDINKILELFISTTLSTFSAAIIAYFGIRRERKKDEKNLKKEWYNAIILGRLIDIVNDYFDSIEGALKTNKTSKFTQLRLKLKRKLDFLKIFDLVLYKKVSKIIIDSADNITDNIPLNDKLKKNNEYKVSILKLIYEGAKNI
ncbi:hypothetical protein [Fusobacterium varium]|uniref:hypothetical protein n=1 Tax=Fusobacterium varium TaxID=856 RepID=UPI002FE4E3F4